ncbi:MAG: L-threonylcarbamoyladenylate synthase [Treponema sp.]|jgi:tRNA threonylcarbamoyl adenosine modification protein (Sua5/YciO/YrdC/YwlC family)|nr:L-threonylcarbamoyladenylate synthase [Treponema sp.]
MIEYIVPSNIDDRILRRAAKLLEDGGLVALPTDTSWSIVCSIKSRAGVKKLRKFSGERDERHFTLLCSSISQFAEVCKLDNTRYRLINRLSPGPYVFILKTLSGTEKFLDIRRQELGVRIPDYPVPIRLIETLNHPLYSITAKKSMTGSEKMEDAGEEIKPGLLPSIPEDELFESGWELEDIDGLDLILDSGEERERIFSTILDMCEDEINVLRQGAGQWPI